MQKLHLLAAEEKVSFLATDTEDPSLWPGLRLTATPLAMQDMEKASRIKLTPAGGDRDAVTTEVRSKAARPRNLGTDWNEETHGFC